MDKYKYIIYFNTRHPAVRINKHRIFIYQSKLQNKYGVVIGMKWNILKFLFGITSEK